MTSSRNNNGNAKKEQHNLQREEESSQGSSFGRKPTQSTFKPNGLFPNNLEDNAPGSVKTTKNQTKEEVTFQKRLKIGKRFAFKVASYKFKQQAQKVLRKKNITLTRLGDSEWYVHDGLIQRALQSPDGCLVYSFGVAESDVYTEFMAQLGCQVFAMDPTVQHPTNWMPRVTFYPWGLANTASSSITDDNSPTSKNWSHPIYGTITGSLFSLPEIIRRLGHDDGRTITAVKFDCEGCEFAAFEDLVNIPNKILMIDTEYHFASTLGMVDANDVARMYYAHLYLHRNKCQLVRQKRHAGFEQDQDKVPQLLTDAGVPGQSCCYEMAYICHGALDQGWRQSMPLSPGLYYYSTLPSIRGKESSIKLSCQSKPSWPL